MTLNGKNLLLMAAIGAGVFLVLRSANAGTSRQPQTTTGEPLYFSEKDGVIYDQLGRVWA